MKISFAVLVMVFALSASAQLKNFRLTAGANYAIIPAPPSGESETLVLPPTGYSNYYTGTAFLSESYKSRPGFSLGSSVDVTVHPKVFLRSGLIFSVINFRLTTTIEGLSSFTPTTSGTVVKPGTPFSPIYGYVIDGIYGGLGDYVVDDDGHLRWADIKPIEQRNEDKIGKTRFFCIQVPLLAGTSLYKDRIVISAGAVVNFLTFASVYQSNFVSVEKENATSSFTSLLPGAMIAIDFKILSRVSAEISGQHYFSPLYKSEYRQAGNSYLNNFVAGLSYRLRP